MEKYIEEIKKMENELEKKKMAFFLKALEVPYIAVRIEGTCHAHNEKEVLEKSVETIVWSSGPVILTSWIKKHPGIEVVRVVGGCGECTTNQFGREFQEMWGKIVIVHRNDYDFLYSPIGTLRR